MRLSYLITILGLVVMMTSCKSCADKKSQEEVTPASGNNPSVSNAFGFGVLNKVKGIWNGPVTSTTPLGGYPEWIVDFRPISENQISAKNELDTANDIFMSFFIAKYNNQLKVGFRNGGSFTNMKRVSYFLADSVSETTTQSFYRFSEIIKGKNKAYTEVIRKGDSLMIKSYTNKYNTLSSAAPHMTWKAKLQDTTSSNTSIAALGFPKNTMSIDFTNTFVGQTEAVYYATSGVPAGDPYPETAQPYLGKTTVNYSYDASHVPVLGKKVLVIMMTQPLFVGITPNLANLKYRSRYVILDDMDQSFVFNYMHPGTYYVYVLYDNDGNLAASTGDWLSTANTSFTLNALGTANVNPQINFTIP